jgi:hypothetical protein
MQHDLVAAALGFGLAALILFGGIVLLIDPAAAGGTKDGDVL